MTGKIKTKGVSAEDSELCHKITRDLGEGPKKVLVFATNEVLANHVKNGTKRTLGESSRCATTGNGTTRVLGENLRGAMAMLVTKGTKADCSRGKILVTSKANKGSNRIRLPQKGNHGL